MRVSLLFAFAAAACSGAEARSILFIGNSFTFGALSPVEHWQPSSVTDLNGDGVGGVPALFKRFTEESGLNYKVSLETAPGRSLDWQWENKRGAVDRRWDAVVMQEYSTLDPDRPGDAGRLIAASGKFARLFRSRNPAVKLALVSTWSRPDQSYVAGRRWSGQPIYQMALDIRSADDRAAKASKIATVAPVGEAFNCAIAKGIADPNPYDGIELGKTDLWASDHYHASTAGYYLEALTIFARVTASDPRKLGRGETAAKELRLTPRLAQQLQEVAFEVAVRGRCQV